MEVSSKNVNYSQPLSAVTVLQLPNELLEIIFKYLKGCDVISFASACKRFSSLSQSVTHLNLENNNFSLGKSLPLVNSFLKIHLNPALLCSCNLNGCYWIPADTLKTFLITCSNLQELYVAETQLTIRDIGVYILPICSKITKLSFTLKQRDWAAFFACTKTNSSLLKNLERLLSIEIITSNFCELCKIFFVLHYCDNLEEIIVSRAWTEWEEDFSKKAYDFQRRQKKIYPRLKSLVFVDAPTEPIGIYQFPFYDVREDCKLTTLWTNILGINCPELKNCQLRSLRWNDYDDMASDEEVKIPLGIRLDDLESYWESEYTEFLMKSIRAPSKLKLVHCFFNSENFQNFCKFVPLIEVLKLEFAPYGNDRASPLVWNSKSWERLSKLRVLSLGADLIGGEKSFKKTTLEDNEASYIPLMLSVVECCPLIEELEIIGWRNVCVSTEELSAIAQCLHLKRLTLSKLNVKDGNFLEQILMSCTKLETLRLREIDNPLTAHCCYIANLCKALPSAKNLTTICLFQNNVAYASQMKILLDSLENNCPLLSRLSLVFPSKNRWQIGKEEFKSRFLRLCEKLTNLVALFGYFRVPFAFWDEMNSVLKERFEEERPALRAELASPETKSGYRYDSIKYIEDRSQWLPVTHSDVLTRCQSQVARFPFDCQSFLRRTF